jgi:hypothetical protein
MEKEAPECKKELEKMHYEPITRRDEKIKKALEKSQNSFEELCTRSKPLQSASK